MLIRKLFLYVICLALAILATGFVLPYAGVNRAHYLPPSWVYKDADGQASGQITNTYSSPTGDPFHIGDHDYFWDYGFYAKEMDPVKNKAVLVPITGEVRVDKESYDAEEVGHTVVVRYEKTYPWINGLDTPPIGLGCGPGSNILSGWLIWLGVAAIVAFVFLAILEHFLPKQDI